MKKKLLFTLFCLSIFSASYSQESITLYGAVPMNFTSTGSGTFNKSVIYHGSSGFLIDLAKNSDNISGIPIDFEIDARGGGQNYFFIKGSNGNLGIGTTSPEAKLQVVSSGSGQIAILGNGGDPNFRIVARQDHSSNDNGALIGEFGLDYGTARNAAIRFHRGTSATGGFMSFTSDSGLERMRIGTNGNIGIGTSNPGFKLDVVGTIRAREIKVDLSGADFVFEENYGLMPLAELEAFIKANKHLPEIQPAAEMESEGVELGELNSKLLQKTEELTLYILQQQKEIEILKSEIKLLMELESRIQNLEKNLRRK